MVWLRHCRHRWTWFSHVPACHRYTQVLRSSLQLGVRLPGECLFPYLVQKPVIKSLQLLEFHSYTYTPLHIKNVMIVPIMQRAKLLTSNSKPTGILSSIASSNFLSNKPEIGPMIIPSMNFGIYEPTTEPIVVVAPITRPRCP